MTIPIDKGMASFAICILGAVSMYITRTQPEPTGIGWAIIGLIIIWGS